MLVEIIAGKHGPLDDDTVARVARANSTTLGIKPDWWKLEPQRTRPHGARSATVIRRNDPYCRGIVLLGLEAPEAELEAAFAAAGQRALVKGFAVGRTIFNEAARHGSRATIGDEAAIADMAGRFGNLVEAWQNVAGTKGPLAWIAPCPSPMPICSSAGRAIALRDEQVEALLVVMRAQNPAPAPRPWPRAPTSACASTSCTFSGMRARSSSWGPWAFSRRSRSSRWADRRSP